MKKILIAMIAVMILVFCVATVSADITLKTNIDDENPVFGSDSQDASNPEADDSDDEEIYDEGDIVLKNNETNSVDVTEISYDYSYDFNEDDLNISVVGSLPTGITNSSDGTLKLKARIPEDLDSINADDDDGDYLEDKAILVADAVLKLSDNSEVTVPLYMQRENMIKVEQIDIDVGDDSYDEDDDDLDEIEPDETIIIEVDISNEYDEDDDNVDMDDVEVRVEIDDDNDFDIDEDSSIELEPEEEGTLKATITMDKDVEDKNYKLTIYIEAEDENNAKHGRKYEYDFDVERKSYDFVIDKAELNYDEVSCSRDNELDIEIESKGSRGDDEVSVYVENRDLGIDFKKEDIDLDDYEGDDNSYSKVLHFTVPEDLDAGTYSINVKLYYSGDEDGGVHADEKDVTLTVNNCAQDSSDDTGSEDTTMPDNVEVGEDGQMEVTVPDEVMQEFGITETVEDSEGFTDSVGFVVLLIVLVAAVLGAEAALIIWLVKKPRA